MKDWPADKVERRSIKTIIPYARNSRTHSAEQVAQIAASIKEWGFTNPILIDVDGEIIAGHGRLLAAQKLGLEEVPCITAVGWSDAQKKAYVIADNKLALNAGWDDELLKIEILDLDALDFDLSLTGFDDKELMNIMGLDDPNKSENPYTNNINTPNYEPSGEKPKIEELYNDEKSGKLIDEIEASSLTSEEKRFLTIAASRHIVFDYAKIANFYAHSSAECQDLMENNALVIVDFDKAIANGFVVLSDEMDRIMSELDDDE